MRVFWPFIRGECMRFFSLNSAQRISIGNWFASDANLGTISGEKTHVQTANEIANHGHGLRVNPPRDLEIENTDAGQYLRAAALKRCV